MNSAKITYEFCQYLSENVKVPITKIKSGRNFIQIMHDINSNEFIDFMNITINGFDNSVKVRSFLRKRYSACSNLDPIRRFTIQEWKDFFNDIHSKSPISFTQFSRSTFRKLSFGYFQKIPFILQFNCKKEVEIEKSAEFYMIGRIRLQAQVVDDEFWWSYPCRVEFANSKIESLEISDKGKELLAKFKLEPKDTTQIFTISPLFTENIRLLEHFSCQGNLELLIQSNLNQEPRLRVNLNSPKKDFLYIL
ncbi:MAG: hypothetical protein ACTSVU_01120 [Promethearchaeota archaeon]